MRTKILVLSFILFLSVNMRSQVTIGELAAPASGALLDLNKAIKGGLALSNIKIEHLYEIPVGFPGISTSGDVTAQVKQDFTGAMVYHTGENNIAAGIYVWNGTNWAPVEENCQPLTAGNLTLAGLPIAKVNSSVSFSASANTSAVCSGGETYSWSVTPATNNTIQTPSAANTSITFTAAGTYKVKVEVTNRYSNLPAVKEKEVTVTTDGALPQTMLNSNYGLVGAACLDVKKSKQPASQSDLAFAARENAFADGNYEKTYKFIHGAAYSELSLDYVDPANLVEAITLYPPELASAGGTAVDSYYEEEFKIKFNSNIQDLVPANGDSLSVQLIASYKPDGSNETKLSYLEIRVEDGTCVCPAKISATQLLYFACHNLGGLDIISPSQIVTRAHHGDWYRWGAKTASVQNLDLATDAAQLGWTYDGNNPAIPAYQDYTTHGTADWFTANDPCPAGWQLPTNDEWSAVVNTSINSSANVPSLWGSAGNTQFGNLKKFGDYLYLPAAGCRDYPDGLLYNRGSYGFYWSNSTGWSNTTNRSNGRYAYFVSGSQDVDNHYYRTYGFSVRCVAAE